MQKLCRGGVSSIAATGDADFLFTMIVNEKLVDWKIADYNCYDRIHWEHVMNGSFIKFYVNLTFEKQFYRLIKFDGKSLWPDR